MNSRQKIYYVEAIAAKEMKDEDLKKKYEKYLISFKDNPKQMSYEQFLDFKKDWKEDKYEIDSFVSSYHLDKNEAIHYAVDNIGDINECGSYPYAAVITACVGVSYYNANIDRYSDILLYKYNKDTDKYMLMEKTDEIYPYLIEHISGLISFG